MARRLNKVFVPFQPLLEKVVAWLHFPSPVYGFIDADKNNVFVRVNRPNSRARFIFYGGDASSVEESRERAAHKAVKRLICRFSVWVSDFTYERIKMYRLCVKLYKNRCAELVQDREDLTRIRSECSTREGVAFNDAHVSVDFAAFLGVLVRKTGVTVTAIETTKLEGHGYMSWLMVTCPHNNIPMECIFSDPCPETTIAEQRVAKKACFFIASVFNLEIVDANYGAAVKISEECSLVGEKYLLLKGHIECLERSPSQPEPANCLVNAECVTPTAEANQILALALPPTLSNKRKTALNELSKSGVEHVETSAAAAAVKCRPEKVVTEKSVTPTVKSNVASPRCSVSHNHNQSRRLSDAARISTTSSSSSSANRIQERQPSGDQSEAGTPRAPSGNILQLAQINSLKQKCVTPNSNTIVNKTLEINNVTMGNILRRNSTDEPRFQSSLSKLDPEELKSLGNDKYKQGKYEEALVLYDQAIAIDSSVAAYRSNKSAVLTALGRLLEAVFECREAVRIDPCYQRAHHRLAGIYIRLGYAEEAVQHFSLSGSIASIADITQAKALGKCLSRCNEAKELKDWGTLLRQTHDALAIGANSSLQIYALQSQALLNLFRHDEAYAAFKRAPYFDMDLYTRLFGETKTTFLYLIKAQIYMSTGRFEDAITAAQTAAQLNPNDKEARKMVIRTRSVAVARSKGNKLFKELKLQEACSIYSEGLEYDPYNSVLLCNRAACRSKLGQFEKAMEDCTLALNLQPSYSKARLRRAHCNAKMERWEASIQDYEILIREKPGDEEVGRALFEAKVQLKKQRGEDVKDMKFGSDVVLVSSIECFRHLITSPGMSVVLFCSKSNQEKAVTLLEQVCLKFPSINFLKVEVEDHPYLVKSEEVTNIPAFKIYKNGTRVRDIPGNNLELLQNSVKLYSS